MWGSAAAAGKGSMRLLCGRQLAQALAAQERLSAVAGFSGRTAVLQQLQPRRHASTGKRGGLRPVQARRSSVLRELAEQRQERREEAEEAGAETVTDLSWESPLRIIHYPDPRLRARNARIGVFDERLARLSRELFEVMYNGDDGVGLAAPQVGVNVRVMVFNPTGRRGEEEVTLVNPRLVSEGKARELGQEGCLSFPQVFAPVERAYRVKVRAQDLAGQPLTLTLTDWRARIFQHEFDHLQGVLFHDRMAPNVLASVRDKLVMLEEEYLREHPGTPVQRVLQPQPS